MIEANRAQLTSLIADNAVGQNTPAITAVEADYAEMWARHVPLRGRVGGCHDPDTAGVANAGRQPRRPRCDRLGG